ncbi:MAG: hypothetical protein NT098_03385 [Candidatus Parcubacteria bacterium]|nr:hypothetical protein [Candidatus Parcubacteria bacterium]
MDDELNGVFDEDETSKDPKVCTECEREFEGEGNKCPDCESESVPDDME